ncbi:MAG: response regulator transcription factor [Rubrivivax sp.]|nr:response regulator transcription factor [Rubrivivax sp.]
MRLLLIEDDAGLGAGLREFLQADGHVVVWCRCLGEAKALHNEPFDALLVDWQLPDGSGLEWVRSLRSKNDHTPVLLMTARDLLDDRVRGLDSGADDYMVKPFDPEELSARLRAITRRASGSGSPRLVFGEVEVDLLARAAHVSGVRAKLTAREWALVEALALRSGRLVKKRELEVLVSNLESEAASNALEVHISNLRRKLGRCFIETVRGLGYRIPT